MVKKKAEDQELTLDTLLSSEEVDVSTLTFEEATTLLEEVVSAVESGTLPLASSVTAYERGAMLVKHLRATLNKAEEKLKLVEKDGSVKEG